MRGVFSADDIASLDAEANRVFAMDELKDTNNIRCRWSDDVETKECRFDCFDPVSDLSPAIGKLARDPRMIGLVSDLYGEPAHLFKDKLIYKPPNAKGYNLHQDYISWPSFPKTFVTAIVAIDPSSAENGATEVFRGYHLKGCLTPLDGNYHQLPDDAVDAATGVMLDLAAGRRRGVQRVHAASLGTESIAELAPAAVSELQRRERRRRSARRALSGISRRGCRTNTRNTDGRIPTSAEYFRMILPLKVAKMAGPVDASLRKFHASLNVSDLDRSIAFYRVLFGLEPAKVKSNYAKFELAEPPLVLSLIPGARSMAVISITPDCACGPARSSSKSSIASKRRACRRGARMAWRAATRVRRSSG